MRDDLVLPPTARRLADAGLSWAPSVGDWIVVFGALHADQGAGNLWLVIALLPDPRNGGNAGGRLVRLVESAGRWAPIQVEERACTWLPTAGQLRTWLRAQGYTVLTGEAPGHQLAGGSQARFRCRATAPSGVPVEAESLTEAEALASVVLHVLGASTGKAPLSTR